MKVALYVKKRRLQGDVRISDLQEDLVAGGCEVYSVNPGKPELQAGTDMLVSIGGDGTFLSAAAVASAFDVPLLGVNLGRLGFLSEYDIEEIVDPIVKGDYTVENLAMLESKVSGGAPSYWPLCVNEVTVHRCTGDMLGVVVTVDGQPLPTYWADGLLVATSAGSTAYALSVGGPICMPDSQVLIIAPIAPHNLNVRPLIVPQTAKINLKFKSREDKVMFTLDNRDMTIPVSSSVDISLAQFSLKKVSLSRSNFIGALRSKLFWGEDKRNM